jgi:hypothetical protein
LKEIEIVLVRAPDDPPERDPRIQEELRAFSKSLRSAGLTVSQRAIAFDSADAVGYPIGQFVIQLAQTGVPAALAAGLGAWLHARYGRKAQVKFTKGRLEQVTARTPEEVGELLKHVADFLDRDRGPGAGA